MNIAAATVDKTIRPLKPDDLERVIAIDADQVGAPRRRFFEKRLAHAKRHPEDIVHVGVVRDGALVGFAMARIMRGEFGREQAVATLDAVSVERDSREHGVGHALMDGVTAVLRQKGVYSLQSESDWTNHSLLRLFDASGFGLAPRLVLERSVLTPLAESADEQ